MAFRWPIPNFQTKWNESHFKNEHLISDLFSLPTRPWIQFILRFETNELEWSKNWYGISIRNFGDNQTIELECRFWFENEEGKEEKERFCEMPAHRNDFDQKVFKAWGWENLPQNKLDLFKKLYDENETIFMCCEINDFQALNGASPDFCQNQMNLYKEGEFFDAKIFVRQEKKEFRVIKSFFMAQSPVFKHMFLQTNFIEAQKNEVKIEDINEEEMLGLIKWCYMSQIDEKCSAEKLFVLADKYQIDMLKSKCTEKMISTLNTKNMLMRLALAEFYNDSYFSKQIMNFMQKLTLSELTKFIKPCIWNEYKEKNPQAANKFFDLVLERFK